MRTRFLLYLCLSFFCPIPFYAQHAGSLDPSFDGDGKVRTSLGDDDFGRSVALQDDGKVLVAGNVYNVGESLSTLIRYRPNGSLDPTFGEEGKVSINLGVAEETHFMSLQEDGKILVSASAAPSTATTGDLVLLRFFASPGVNSRNFADEIQGAVLYPNPAERAGVLEYTLSREELLSIDLYDSSGRWMQSVLSRQKRTKGKHREQFDLDRALPAGTYWLVIDNGFGHWAVQLVK